MNINERLESIRKSEKLSRSKFGLKVGKTEDAIYNLERNRASISKEFIELVCNTFNINKEWLVNGTGQMYNISQDTLDMSNVFDKIINSEELYKLVHDITELSEEKVKVLSDLVEILYDSEKKESVN